MANDLDPRLTPVQRFGRELARVRKEASLTQVTLSKHLGCSSSLVAHIEIGDRTPKPDLARRCDEVFGTSDLFARLCRNITSPASGPGWFIKWADEIEPRARTLRSWDPLLIPGLLQTEGYARAVFKGGRPVSAEEIEERVRARMRRKLILERDNPPELWVLIDESVLQRPVGGPAVMVEQLDYLAELADRPGIRVQLVPFDTPCTDGFLSSFTIAELPDAPTVVSIESAGTGEVSTAYDLVAAAWGQYDRIRAEAYRPGESLKMIKEVRDQWRRKQET
ncbi:helix-turn-helix domain-containing protein [Sphaerisporangium fuscum]|uniref:helix-turn-helix domain-containing protein n=1 Tax=Sphaerisporangium fuscum TaxID=2835868 RepID=UPI001BDD41D3|nr:helix-turn-helix transcriptional regulator [Sphaerisporangium fuscum]